MLTKIILGKHAPRSSVVVIKRKDRGGIAYTLINQTKIDMKGVIVTKRWISVCEYGSYNKQPKYNN